MPDDGFLDYLGVNVVEFEHADDSDDIIGPDPIWDEHPIERLRAVDFLNSLKPAQPVDSAALDDSRGEHEHQCAAECEHGARCSLNNGKHISHYNRWDQYKHIWRNGEACYQPK
jgi:hypothetical protein